MSKSCYPVLYYKNANWSTLKFVTKPYTGYSDLATNYCTNKCGKPITSQLVSFTGFYTPARAPKPGLPALPHTVNETCEFRLPNGFIAATAIYVDPNFEAQSYTTTLPFVTYTVTAASGVFKGANTVTIRFNNTTGIRTCCIQ